MADVMSTLLHIVCCVVGFRWFPPIVIKWMDGWGGGNNSAAGRI